MATFSPTAVRSEMSPPVAGASSATSRPVPRVSMEDYYHHQLLTPRSHRPESPPSSDGNIDDPPGYDTAVSGLPPLAESKSKIEPRADEGCESLPAYTCSIQQHAVFRRKMELQSAVHKAQDRTWYKVWAVLEGTALRIFSVRKEGMFSSTRRSRKTSADQPEYLKRGELLKTYSLQHAEVGIAADYTKRRYVIRVRVETEQFLLSCIEIETFLCWIESLSAAIDLAPALDERKIPVDQSMPRRRRRRAPAVTTASATTTATPATNPAARNAIPTAESMEGNADLVRQQQSIINAQFPQLGSGTGAEDVAAPQDRRLSQHRRAASHISSAFSRRSSVAAAQAEQEPLRPICLQQAALQAPSSRSASSSSTSASSSQQDLTSHASHCPPTQAQPTSHPSRARAPTYIYQTPSTSSTSSSSDSIDDKWAPIHAWTPTYDMLYAKRCMAVLLNKSPRKTNLVIMRGKQWVIDWATGALQRCDPPDYGEVELAGNWGLSPGGQIVRI